MDFLSFLLVLHLKVQIIITVKHIYTGFNSSSLVDTDCDAELMWWSSALLCYTYTSDWWPWSGSASSAKLHTTLCWQPVDFLIDTNLETILSIMIITHQS